MNRMGVVPILFLSEAGNVGILWVLWIFEWVFCPGITNSNDGAEFHAFLLLEKHEICWKFENTCIKAQCNVDNFVVCHRHTGCIRTSASMGLNGMLSERCTFEYFKDSKEEGWRLPLPCPRKREIDSGIVA